MTPESKLIFQAPYDTTTKVISAVVCVMLLGIAAAIHMAPVAGIAGLVLLAAWAYSPRRYEIGKGVLAVRRPIGSVRIPLADIREIRPSTADDFRGAIRLWGSGGLFGYYGLFSTAVLGRSWWYVTDRKRAVIVRTDAKTIVVSPDDVSGFVAAIGGGSGPWGPQPGPAQEAARRGIPAGPVVAVMIAVAVLGLIAAALLYAPGPPPYTLTSDSLTIHDRFYAVTVKAGDVDTGRIRIVDIGSDPEWRPTARTNGFANAHYRSGWFRVANGQTVRMYWADSRHLVLLPPRGDGHAVLLQVPDAEIFFAEVRRKWSGGA
ncbi:MAG: PH domain-containing protein [Bryobacteraceae bacterium]